MFGRLAGRHRREARGGRGNSAICAAGEGEEGVKDDLGE